MRLIDADRLRDDFLAMPNCYNGFSDSYDKAMIVDMVDEQPTVDAVPVVHGYDTGESRIFHCSVCGYGVDDVYENVKGTVVLYEAFEEWRFCPNCGAKVGERKDE